MVIMVLKDETACLAIGFEAMCCKLSQTQLASGGSCSFNVICALAKALLQVDVDEEGNGVMLPVR